MQDIILDPDTPAKPAGYKSWFAGIVTAAAFYSFAGGLLTLAGWYLDYPSLTDWNSEGISMFPNTALCSITAGLLLILNNNSFYLQRPGIILFYIASFGLTAISAMTLLQHLSGIDFGIDTILISEAKPWGQKATESPMRMGLPASFSFLCLSTALILMKYGCKQRKLASNLALLVFFIALLSLTGYWLGANQLFGIAKITGIAWQTSTMIAALSLGIMFAIPEHGFVNAAFREDSGGAVLRSLILPIIFIPLLLAWMQIYGQKQGYFDDAFSIAISTIIEIIVLIALLWWTAGSISRHNNLMQLADKRKDEFPATLSHELRNPLAAIVNSLELLKVSVNSPEKIEKSGGIIKRQVDHLVKLVDDLLDVSRISRDRLELKMETFTLTELFTQATESFNHFLTKKNQELVIKLPKEPVYLKADLVRMVQILVNLVNNSSKFTNPNGRIVLSAETSADRLLITINDNGVGISAKMLPKVFEMFTQVSRSIEQNPGGLGIGLAIVKKLVELHNGTITVSSNGEGHGTTFILELPVITEPPPENFNSEEKNIKSIKNKARILIVEDNIDTAVSLSLLLETEGHQTMAIHNGDEALKTAESFKPEIILLDIGLPGMNGFDVCREIRCREWGKEMVIIALSGWGQEKDRQKSKDSGFTQHLVKPVDSQTLLKLIASYLT